MSGQVDWIVGDALQPETYEAQVAKLEIPHVESYTHAAALTLSHVHRLNLAILYPLSHTCATQAHGSPATE